MPIARTGWSAAIAGIRIPEFGERRLDEVQHEQDDDGAQESAAGASNERDDQQGDGRDADSRVAEVAMRLLELRVVEQAETDEEDLDDDRRHEDPGHHGERDVQIADHPTPPFRDRLVTAGQAATFAAQV